MLHRIREMMKPKDNIKLDNIVEVDEVYIGGRVPNMSKSKRKKLRDTGTINEHKTMVMGFFERGGNLKLIPVGGSNSIMAIQPTVRDSVIHTNSIEGAFSLLKRSIIGIYHQVTPKHLARYCDETMFRYNLRGMNDATRFNYSIRGCKLNCVKVQNKD